MGTQEGPQGSRLALAIYISLGRPLTQGKPDPTSKCLDLPAERNAVPQAGK